MVWVGGVWEDVWVGGVWEDVWVGGVWEDVWVCNNRMTFCFAHHYSDNSDQSKVIVASVTNSLMKLAEKLALKFHQYSDVQQ